MSLAEHIVLTSLRVRPEITVLLGINGLVIVITHFYIFDVADKQNLRF
jgi:hypothetical protein